MSYLNLKRQYELRKREQELKSFRKKYTEKESARKNAKPIGKLLIDGQIIPVTDFRYEPKTKHVKDKIYGGYLVERDGYKGILDVLFPDDLRRKYILNYVVIQIKDDEQLQQLKNLLNTDNIIDYSKYQEGADMKQEMIQLLADKVYLAEKCEALSPLCNIYHNGVQGSERVRQICAQVVKEAGCEGLLEDVYNRYMTDMDDIATGDDKKRIRYQKMLRDHIDSHMWWPI